MELATGHKAIGLKWIFKIKKDTDEAIMKHKETLMERGYMQKQGINFEESFAPVTRLETVHLLLILSATNGWEVHHYDVKLAFLNREIHDEVYVLQPVVTK